MKKILVSFILLGLAAGTVRAQDAETADRLAKAENYIQELQAAQADQEKQIEALEKEINDLRDKLNQPAANDFAGQDDLRKLAEQVQELAKKQQSDNDQIVKAIEKLGKAGIGSAASSSHHETVNSTPAPNTANAGGPQNGFYYKVQEGNTLSAIAKAYRAQNIKVTVDDILKANPGLSAKNLYVGRKIFIPAPQSQ